MDCEDDAEAEEEEEDEADEEDEEEDDEACLANAVKWGLRSLDDSRRWDISDLSETT